MSYQVKQVSMQTNENLVLDTFLSRKDLSNIVKKIKNKNLRKQLEELTGLLADNNIEVDFWYTKGKTAKTSTIVIKNIESNDSIEMELESFIIISKDEGCEKESKAKKEVLIKKLIGLNIYKSIDEIADMIFKKVSLLKYYNMQKLKFNELGLNKYNNEEVLFMGKACTINKVLEDSEYVGNLDLSQAGDMERSMKVLNILSKTTAGSILIGAAISGLYRTFIDIPDSNIILNIAGKSGTGKTTATNAVLSIFMNPRENTAPFMDTTKSLELKLAERKMLPLVIDDRLVAFEGKSKRKAAYDLLEEIFRFYEGKVQSRVTTDARLKELGGKKYLSPVISTSETSYSDSLINLNTKAEGHFYRFIELGDDNMIIINSKEDAERLEELSSENYGHFCYGLATALMIGTDIIRKRFDERKVKIRKKLADKKKELNMKSNIERCDTRIAVIVECCRLCADCLITGYEENFNLEAIEDALIKSYVDMLTKVNETNQYTKEIRELHALCTDKLKLKGNASVNDKEGDYHIKEDYTFIRIDGDELEKLFDSKDELQKFVNYLNQNKGKIYPMLYTKDNDNTHLTKKVTLVKGGKQLRYYHIKLENQTRSDEND